MDTKENQNEENNDNGATVDQPEGTNVNNNNTSNISPGLQQIEDDNSGMPLPMGMAEVISNRAEPPKEKIGKVEQLDDDDGPEPPVAMLEASLNADDPEIISKTISNNLSSINELSPPVPFDSANYEDTIAKKIANDEMNQKPAAVSNDDEAVVLSPPDRDSIYEPSREIIEEGEDISDNTNTGRGGTNRRGWDDFGSGSNNDRDIESQTRPSNNHEDTGSSINDADAQADAEPTSINQEGLPEVEAYLVEDLEEEEVEVYMATPTLPWWKQRRTKIFFGVVIVLIGALAVALVVSLSRSNDVFVTPPPTISIAPSSSLAPSTSPPPITYECFSADDGGRDGILHNAVRLYMVQDCANNEDCLIGQTYGWPINSWCVGNVQDMSHLFSQMNTFNENIHEWNTSSVTDMRFMFSSSSFNGDVSSFDTSSVTDMTGMFLGASAFNGDLSNFDTSRVTDMFGMFWGATAFNGDVSNFNTSSVTIMYSMFSSATSFNGDVSNFDTSKVTDMESMFSGATASNGGLSNFDTSSVTSMGGMFAYATSFNRDLSNFNTSSVINMGSMFRGATAFNGNVSSFDTSSATSMYYMFYNATSFNKDLCSWQDSFPYTADTANIFTDSGCTYQATPNETRKGPFVLPIVNNKWN